MVVDRTRGVHVEEEEDDVEEDEEEEREPEMVCRRSDRLNLQQQKVQLLIKVADAGRLFDSDLDNEFNLSILVGYQRRIHHQIELPWYGNSLFAIIFNLLTFLLFKKIIWFLLQIYIR